MKKLVPSPNVLPPAHNVKDARDHKISVIFKMSQPMKDRLKRESNRLQISASEIVRLSLQAFFDGRIGVLEPIRRHAK